MNRARLEVCYRGLNEAGGQLGALGEPCRSMVVADTACGIIGNGGFRYFFEANFPGDPDYTLFVDAFRRVGLDEIANRLAALIALFPFDAPHKLPALREVFLGACPTEFVDQMAELETLIWDVDIDAVLEHYADGASS